MMVVVLGLAAADIDSESGATEKLQECTGERLKGFYWNVEGSLPCKITLLCIPSSSGEQSLRDQQCKMVILSNNE